mgnify:CR=1 FL=1|tara:strand:- start:312 stop:938 length:627 start_codon:yes stop_codon:yes gene_type:complete
MSKLGFTFYPKDWWTSDTYFDLNIVERYYYLEMLFIMYQNDGYFTLTKEKFERRLLTQIKPSEWEKITQHLTKSDLGYSHSSVNKRRTKAVVARENGAKGGRPKKPKNPALNPSLEYKEKEKEKENRKVIENKGNSIPNFSEFLDHAISKEPNVDEYALRLKFESWVENGWKDGNNRKITNWKSKLTNTIQFISKGTNSRTKRKVKVF